jgi:tRNA pseudouridine38-40 synthase
MLVLEYDGTPFCGWQRQQTSLGVQQVLEEALTSLLSVEIRTFAAGRTDAGVHAIHQVVHFDSVIELDPFKLPLSLNHFMRPYPVCVASAQAVPDSFHARFSAKMRRYEYYILNRTYPSVLSANRAWYLPKPLDIGVMLEAAELFIGTHDFTSFRSSQCQSASPIKTIANVSVHNINNYFIKIEVKAQSFLHNQVRIMVGSLVNVGLKKWSTTKVAELLTVRNRGASAATAPACGLYFSHVEY